MKRVLCLSLVVLFVQAAAQAAVLDFDGYAPGTTDLVGSGCTVGGVGAVAANGIYRSADNVFQFAGNAPGIDGSLAAPVVDHAQGVVTLSTWFYAPNRAPDNTSNRCTFTMMLKDGSEYGARVNFGTRNKDVAVYANGTSTTYSNAFSAAKWVKATMVLDEPTQTWDFIVEDADGNTLLNLQDLNFYSSKATKMTSATMLVVKYGGAYGDDIRVDDVSLEVVPEPGTLVLLAMGSVALYRRRRI